MALEQRAEVDVEQLVAVHREHVAVLGAAACGEPDPAAAAERLRLLGRDDLGAEPVELALEQLALAGGAAHDHAVDARCREPGDRVGDERPSRDLDERLRAPTCGVAEALGLAAGEDDRLHGSEVELGSRSGVSPNEPSGEAARPMPS